jgi:hypothetical protein
MDAALLTPFKMPGGRREADPKLRSTAAAVLEKEERSNPLRLRPP